MFSYSPSGDEVKFRDIPIVRIGNTLYGQNVAYLPYVPSDVRSYHSVETIRVDTFRHPRVFGMVINPSPDRLRKDTHSIVYMIDDMEQLRIIDQRGWSIMMMDMDPERSKPFPSDRFTIYFFKSQRLPWSDAQAEGSKKIEVFVRTYCYKSIKPMKDKKFQLTREYYNIEKTRTIMQHMEAVPETLRKRIGEYLLKL